MKRSGCHSALKHGRLKAEGAKLQHLSDGTNKIGDEQIDDSRHSAFLSLEVMCPIRRYVEMRETAVSMSPGSVCVVVSYRLWRMA
jgi:hypothetical protein